MPSKEVKAKSLKPEDMIDLGGTMQRILHVVHREAQPGAMVIRCCPVAQDRKNKDFTSILTSTETPFVVFTDPPR